MDTKAIKKTSHQTKRHPRIKFYSGSPRRRMGIHYPGHRRNAHKYRPISDNFRRISPASLHTQPGSNYNLWYCAWHPTWPVHLRIPPFRKFLPIYGCCGSPGGSHVIKNDALNSRTELYQSLYTTQNSHCSGVIHFRETFRVANTVCIFLHNFLALVRSPMLELCPCFCGNFRNLRWSCINRI